MLQNLSELRTKELWIFYVRDKVRYRCLLALTVCNTTLKAFAGVLESPNYPYAYDSNTNCLWVIETTVGNTINASFSRFDLQPQVLAYCSNDYVEVRLKCHLVYLWTIVLFAFG